MYSIFLLNFYQLDFFLDSFKTSYEPPLYCFLYKILKCRYSQLNSSNIRDFKVFKCQRSQSTLNAFIHSCVVAQFFTYIKPLQLASLR